jgi:tetratricopeptide (TPR) repeat protein
VSSLPAQDTKRLINTAVKFQQSGLYQDALPLYQNIYGKGNRSFQVISGLSRCLEELKKYDDLILLFNNLEKQYPERLNYTVDKARIYYLNGEQDTAFTIWQSAYQKYPNNINAYRMVGSVLVQLRLYDKAIEVYKSAVNNAEKGQTFNRDIAMLYKAQSNHTEAIKYFLTLYKNNPKEYNYVNQQIISMAVDDESVINILAGLENYVSKNDPDENIQELQAEMFIRNREFDSAYNIYQNLNIDKSNDRFLLRFASEAEANKAFEYAIKAYTQLLKYPRKQSLQLSLQLRMAQTQYHFGDWLRKIGKKTQADSEVQGAIEIINIISQSNPNFPEKWLAVQLEADIYHHYFHELDKAVSLYQSLLQAPPKVINLDMVYYRLGFLYLQKNNLATAEKNYKKILGRQYRNLAHYRLAEISFFKGKFAQSKQGLEKLSRGLAADDTLMNNVLSRLSFIDHHVEDSLQLAIFAKAELLLIQNKNSEALDIFLELSKSPSELSISASHKTALIYMNSKKYQDAEQVMEHLIEKYPQAINMDFAYYLLAEANNYNHNYTKALDAYRFILANYPNSFYTDLAREKARDLVLILKDVP